MELIYTYLYYLNTCRDTSKNLPTNLLVGMYIYVLSTISEIVISGN